MKVQARPLLSAVLVGLFALAPDAAHAADARLGEAEALARRNEPAAAADLYRALLAEGTDGAALRYNLGTLALDEGKIGEAVLHLLAARRLAPGDGDIAHNFTVALDARTDRLGGDTVVSPIHALGAAVPPLAARLALAIPLGLVGIALALLGVLDGAARPRARRLVVVTAGVLGLLTVAGAVVRGARASVESTRVAVVLVDATPALKDPAADAAEAFVAHAGLFGDVVDEDGAFLRVRFENGLEAWLEGTAVGVLEAMK